MPKQNPEHGARLEIRLPAAMLRAIRWTARHDRLPLSGWIRDALNRRCFSVATMRDGRQGKVEALVSGPVYRVSGRFVRSWRGRGKSVMLRATDIVAERVMDDDAEEWGWTGERVRDRREIRTYVDLDGNEHVGGLPAGHDIAGSGTFIQDHRIERAQARTELRNWLHKWKSIPPKQIGRLTPAEVRAAERLLAKLDRDWE